MNKIITFGLLAMFLLLIIGCGKEAPPSEEIGAEETTITQANEAIDNADNMLEDIEDIETDAELDDIENVLDQI